jgi:hypothetical protein
MTAPTLAGAAAALVTALVGRLAADAAVVALVGDRVHETPPRNATYPYLVIDVADSDDRSGLDAPLARHRIEIRAYARDGKPAALAVVAAASAAHTAPLTSAGCRVVLLDVAGSAARLLKDRLTAEATLRLSVLTEAE